MHIMRPANHPLTAGLIEFVNSLLDKLVMAEIGSYGGESTSFFVKKASKIFCVDPWQNYVEHNEGGQVVLNDLGEAEAAFDRVVAANPGIIIKMKGASLDMARHIADGSLDMAYVDANHEYEYVLADINAWLPKVKKGGIIAGHDYNYTDPVHGTRVGVEKAVREKFGSADKIFQDTTWMKKL